MWIIEVAKRTPPPKHKSTDVKVRFHSLSSLTKCFPIFKGIKPRKSETPPNKNMAKYFVPFKSIIVHSGWLYTTDDNRYDFCKINIIISTLLSRFLTSVWSCISKRVFDNVAKMRSRKTSLTDFLLIRTLWLYYLRSSIIGLQRWLSNTPIDWTSVKDTKDTSLNTWYFIVCIQKWRM